MGNHERLFRIKQPLQAIRRFRHLPAIHRVATMVRRRYIFSVRYTVILTDEVKVRLRALPLRLRREIGHKLFLLEEDLSGNVRKLKGSRNQYRLRSGDYRILFELEGRTVIVYAVGNRKDIYR
jgi:mRNA interferase RelE/StbE